MGTILRKYKGNNMGNNLHQRLTLRLKEDVQLQSSNRIATDAVEFEKMAYKFEAGTLFVDCGRGVSKPNEDEDCVENDGPHGWCYSRPGEPDVINYCNFHAYILDYWTQYPELFEEINGQNG